MCECPYKTVLPSLPPLHPCQRARPLSAQMLHLLQRLRERQRPQHRTKYRVPMTPAERRACLRLPHTRNPSPSLTRDGIKCSTRFHLERGVSPPLSYEPPTPQPLSEARIFLRPQVYYCVNCCQEKGQLSHKNVFIPPLTFLPTLLLSYLFFPT